MPAKTLTAPKRLSLKSMTKTQARIAICRDE